MLNYYTSQNCLVRNVSRMLCAAVFLLMALSFANAQTCPTTPAAGRASPTLETGVTTHVYPSALPAGVTVGTANVPYGAMIHNNSKGVISPLSTVTVHPQWSDGTMGWAIINFYYLEIANSGAIIKVYNGDGTATTPVATITSANASTYYRFNHKNNGPITVTMENTTNTGTGNFDVEVTYMTGEVVATTPLGQELTYYKQFITPNSHAYVDSRAGFTSTTATGYFDANRDLVSTELSWCIDYGRSAPRRGNWYPGGLVYNPKARPDIDEDGTVTTQDKLKTARLIYILEHAPQPITDPANYGAVRAAVDDITHWGAGTGLAADAIAAIPSLPSPEEPTFSITGPASSVSAGSPQNFVVNLISDGGHPRVYKLKVPAGVTVNSVTGTGVTYNTANQDITFASSPASATVSVTSPGVQTATVGVAYEQPGFWNVTNLIVYEPCDLYNQPGVSGRDYQAFLGLSKSEKPYPIREASGTWEAIPAVDYGDLPNTYATTSASNGPSHAITGYNATSHTASLMLGSLIDSETDGVAGTAANGDDNSGVDDEDAITRFPLLTLGQRSYSLTVPVTNTTGATATVRGWIDFNRDGTFGTDEVATQIVADGGTSVTLNWSGFTAAVTAGEVYARFRIASNASEIASASGAAASGEVEDYRLYIGRTISGFVFNDINRNTRKETGESFSGMPVPMYVYTITGNIIGDWALVASDGAYSLTAPINQVSDIHLSTIQYPIGTDISSTPIDHTPPTGFVTTGENISGTDTGFGDGIPNGILQISASASNLINRNFGITNKTAGTSKATDICASEANVMPLAEFIDGEDAGGTWSQLTGSGIIFDAGAGTIQLTSSATTSTFRYDIPATGGNPGSFSIATVNVRPIPVKYQSITICEGELLCIRNPAGTARVVGPQQSICHSTSGVYSDTLTGATRFGCDSIVVTTLTVIPIPNAGNDGNVTACNSSTTPIDLFSLITGEQTGGTWQRLTGTGGTFNAAAGTFIPAVGATNSTFSYTIAGAGSCPADVSVATVNVNNCTVQIAGNVWNDGNGNAVKNAGELPVSGNNTNNGGTSVASGGNIYANLVNGANEVVQSVQVNADGSYNFTGVPEALPYKVVLTTTPQAETTVITTGNGPTNWVATGTNLGGIASTSNTSYIIDLGTVTADVNNADFGIQRPPIADAKTFVVANSAFTATPSSPFPSVTGYQAIPASSSALTGYTTGGSLSGSDAEDCASAGTCNTATGTTFTIETINANTKLYYNFGSGPVEMTAGTQIPNFNVNDLVIYGANGGGAAGSEFGFEYTITDKAGVESTAVPYTIQTQSALPVTLLNFDVVAEGQTANLKWSTTAEANSKGFEVQRSTNASNWSMVGYVASQNQNSNGLLSYQFTDTNPLTGINYYRLKMVDLDGTFAYSQIRSIGTDKAARGMVTYPNPVVNGKLTIDVTATGSYQAEVYNLSGVRVLQYNLGTGRELNVSKLTSGLYVLRLKSAAGEVQTSTFVVK